MTENDPVNRFQNGCHREARIELLNNFSIVISAQKTTPRTLFRVDVSAITLGCEGCGISDSASSMSSSSVLRSGIIRMRHWLSVIELRFVAHTTNIDLNFGDIFEGTLSEGDKEINPFGLFVEIDWIHPILHLRWLFRAEDAQIIVGAGPRDKANKLSYPGRSLALN